MNGWIDREKGKINVSCFFIFLPPKNLISLLLWKIRFSFFVSFIASVTHTYNTYEKKNQYNIFHLLIWYTAFVSHTHRIIVYQTPMVSHFCNELIIVIFIIGNDLCVLVRGEGKWINPHIRHSYTHYISVCKWIVAWHIHFTSCIQYGDFTIESESKQASYSDERVC